MSTRLGTTLFPRGPLGTSGAGRFGPRGSLVGGTRQGSRLFPMSGLAFFSTSRSATQTVFTRTPFQALTREGTRLFPRGPLGTYFTRVQIPGNTVNMPVGHLTFTPVAQGFLAAQDQTIEFPAAVDESFTAGATFTVEQGGSLVDIPTAHITFTPTVGGQGFSVLQTNANDHTVFLPTANLTFTPIGFDTIYTNTVELPTGHLTYTPNGSGFDVSITLPGQQTLTQADILAIWQNINICGFNPQDALCIISAAVAGQLRGAGHPGPHGIQHLEFLSTDGSGRVVITADVDPHGNRVAITLTP